MNDKRNKKSVSNNNNWAAYIAQAQCAVSFDSLLQWWAMMSYLISTVLCIVECLYDLLCFFMLPLWLGWTGLKVVFSPWRKRSTKRATNIVFFCILICLFLSFLLCFICFSLHKRPYDVVLLIFCFIRVIIWMKSVVLFCCFWWKWNLCISQATTFLMFSHSPPPLSLPPQHRTSCLI